MSEENKTALFKCLRCSYAGRSFYERDSNDNNHYFEFANGRRTISNGKCELCDGSGKRGGELCKRCDGTGICPVCHGLGMVSINSNVVALGANLDAIKEYELALKERFSQEASLIEAKRNYEELQSETRLSVLEKEIESLQLAIELEKLKSGKNSEDSE